MKNIDRYKNKNKYFLKKGKGKISAIADYE